jgi:hypothetical protein
MTEAIFAILGKGKQKKRITQNSPDLTFEVRAPVPRRCESQKGHHAPRACDGMAGCSSGWAGDVAAHSECIEAAKSTGNIAGKNLLAVAVAAAAAGRSVHNPVVHHVLVEEHHNHRRSFVVVAPAVAAALQYHLKLSRTNLLGCGIIVALLRIIIATTVALLAVGERLVSFFRSLK